MDALTSPSPATRDQAAAKLQALGPAAVPDLVRLLRTPDPFLARPARRVARWLPAKANARLFRIINPLEAAAKRAAAAQALRILGPGAHAAIPALSRALEDDLTVAWYASLALAQMGPDGLEALSTRLSTVPPIQCGYICYALGTQGQSASNATPNLVLLLEKDDPVISDKAATALGNMGRLGVPGLLRASTNQHGHVRTLAIGALSRIGPLARDAIPRLVTMAKEDQPGVREAAVEALGQVGPTSPAVTAALTQALVDPVREVRLKAILALGRSPAHSASAVPELIGRLNDPSADVRGQAASLLGEIAAPRETIISALGRALKDENEVVRTKAGEALNRLRASPPRP